LDGANLAQFGDLVHVEKFFERNLGSLIRARDRQAGSVYEGNSRTMNMHADENSDGAIVPEKRSNKVDLMRRFATEQRVFGAGRIG
jgi:hypothetical protein